MSKYSEAMEAIKEHEKELQRLKELTNENEIGVLLLYDDLTEVLLNQENNREEVGKYDLLYFIEEIAKETLRSFFLDYPFEKENLPLLKKSIELVYVMNKKNIDSDIRNKFYMTFYMTKVLS